MALNAAAASTATTALTARQSAPLSTGLSGRSPPAYLAQHPRQRQQRHREPASRATRTPGEQLGHLPPGAGAGAAPARDRWPTAEIGRRR
jgi:hypothetical protein